MDRQELIDNLGTIARSGTKSFLSRLTEAKDGAGLIGQFGVGFYAAFMVAERIVVTSRRAGSDEVWTWSSSGGSGFEIAPGRARKTPARITRGTEIVLHLKDERAEISRDLRDRAHRRRLFRQHPVSDRAGAGGGRAAPDQFGQRAVAALEIGTDAGGLQEAYKSIAGAFDEPAMTLHYRAEGRQSYAVLLFAPSTKPFDLFDQARKGKVKLYVRRVFIADDADLLPAYLRFIRGVIDSEDLPLNISREMLQNNPQLAQIRKAVTSRVVSELENLGDKEPEAFAKIWDSFGPVIKEGIWEDFERREKLLGAVALHHDVGREAFAEAVCRGPEAEPDRDLLPHRRQHRAAEVESETRIGDSPRHRGVAADRSGRCVLDLGAARFRRQAAEVAEPGRYRFRPDPAAGRQGGRRKEAKPPPTRPRPSPSSRTRSASASPTCGRRSG